MPPVPWYLPVRREADLIELLAGTSSLYTLCSAQSRLLAAFSVVAPLISPPPGGTPFQVIASGRRFHTVAHEAFFCIAFLFSFIRRRHCVIAVGNAACWLTVLSSLLLRSWQIRNIQTEHRLVRTGLCSARAIATRRKESGKDSGAND